MKNLKKVLLVINSNSPLFNVCLNANDLCLCKTVSAGQCLCVYTNSPWLYVSASPRTAEFYGGQKFMLNLNCARLFNLSAIFLQNAAAPSPLSTFFLLDKNYGLRLDGVLSFNKIN